MHRTTFKNLLKSQTHTNKIRIKEQLNKWFQIILHLQIRVYIKFCDKTMKLKTKNKHFRSLTHKDFERCKQKNYTNRNPNFLDVSIIYNDYITNHNKKLEA